MMLYIQLIFVPLVNVEGLKAVMTDVAKYCSKQSIPNRCHPLPGAACCAQFSGQFHLHIWLTLTRLNR